MHENTHKNTCGRYCSLLLYRRVRGCSRSAHSATRVDDAAELTTHGEACGGGSARTQTRKRPLDRRRGGRSSGRVRQRRTIGAGAGSGKAEVGGSVGRRQSGLIKGACEGESGRSQTRRRVIMQANTHENTSRRHRSLLLYRRGSP